MNLVWVVGGHGLLGSALVRTLQRGEQQVFEAPRRLRWNERTLLHADLAQATTAFVAAAQGADTWCVCWAAGVGTMLSTHAAMALETAAFKQLLDALAANPSMDNIPGRIALASSAGAIYAGCRDAVITEASRAAPTTPYAQAKLQQEASLAAYMVARPSVAALAARLSTIYGVGQESGKQQGLLSHIARCTVRGEPVRIYVPLDTIRDYMAVDDAAAAITQALREVPTGGMQRKLIASERPTTISELLSIFRRISRRPPRIITAAAAASSLYARKVQFRSVLLPDTVSTQRVSLVVGIARLMDAERARHAAGKRALPPAH